MFGPGTYTLTTGNIPLLDKIINLPFGGNTPFSAEVWFVNLTAKRDLKWGTPNPIPLMDPALNFPVSLRAFGKWGMRINDARSFVAQLVGARVGADSDQVHGYFIGEIVQRITNVLSSALRVNQIGVLDLSARISDISSLVASEIKDEFTRFGVEVVNFNVENISIPDSELEKIQDVFAKTMEAEQLSKVNPSGGYAAIKSYEILNSAASNESESGGLVGGMLGAGIGLGAGLPLGQQLGQRMDLETQNRQASAKEDQDGGVKGKLIQLKELFDEGLIDENAYNQKRQELLDQL